MGVATMQLSKSLGGVLLSLTFQHFILNKLYVGYVLHGFPFLALVVGVFERPLFENLF